MVSSVFQFIFWSAICYSIWLRLRQFLAKDRSAGTSAWGNVPETVDGVGKKYWQVAYWGSFVLSVYHLIIICSVVLRSSW